MKNTLKIISDVAIILFGIQYIGSKFLELRELGNPIIGNILVIIFLITSVYHSKMELKDKDREIVKLESRIKKLEKSSSY